MTTDSERITRLEGISDRLTIAVLTIYEKLDRIDQRLDRLETAVLLSLRMLPLLRRRLCRRRDKMVEQQRTLQMVCLLLALLLVAACTSDDIVETTSENAVGMGADTRTPEPTITPEPTPEDLAERLNEQRKLVSELSYQIDFYALDEYCPADSPAHALGEQWEGLYAVYGVDPQTFESMPSEDMLDFFYDLESILIDMKVAIEKC